LKFPSIDAKEFRDLLDLIPANICVLDETGQIIFANTSWEVFAKTYGISEPSKAGVGANYLEFCSAAQEISEEHMNGIQAVLDREIPTFESEYFCDVEEEKLWFVMKAVTQKGRSGCWIFHFDITQKKKLEEESSRNEALYKNLSDHSPAIIYTKDMYGKYIHINKKAEDIFGVKNEEVVGKNPFEVFSRDIAEQFVKNDRKVMGSSSPQEVEEVIPYKGGVMTVLSQQFPLIDSDGKLMGIAGISTDITDRKAAEEELGKYKKDLEEALSINEEKLQLLLQATTNGVWDWDLTTNKVLFSPRWLESLGYNPGELNPDIDSWKKLVHPDDMSRVTKALTDHLEGVSESYQCENRILKKDGTWRWNLELGRIVKRDESGKPLRIVGSDTDISGLKEAEFALRASEQRLAQAQEMASLGSWELDVNENILNWSDEVYRIFGLSKKQFNANYEAFLETVHPEDRDWVHEANMKSLRENIPYDITHRIVLPDGSIKTVQEKSKTYFDKEGYPTRVHGTVLDITEKKEAEEKLKKSHQQLRDLSNKLQTIREEDKKRISREIHDELGQTLTAIKLDLTWLEKRVDVSEPIVLDKIKSIYSHIENSLETVRRVSTELRPQVLDVMGFCEALQWQAEKFMENTDIKCKLNIEPEGIKLQPELSTDLFRISQEALTNISRHSQASRVIIDFVENKTVYQLRVKDDGVGIDQLRIDHSASLGLLGIRERALIWEGNVEIKGVVGEGTLLTVEIPKVNK
jgi:PAS domain S-box-containing protein